MKDDDDARLMAAVDRLYDTEDAAAMSNLGRSQQDVGAAGVYGEMTAPATLFRALALSEADHFIDLGSGRGQIVLAAMLRTDGPAPESSVGVELIDTRCEVAKHAWERTGAAVRARSAVRCGDATVQDLSSVTKAFVCNTTFDGGLNSSICRSLAPELAPKLDAVATMQPFTDASAAEASLVLTSVTAVHATWAPSGTPLYVYSRTNGESANAASRLGRPCVDASAVNAMLAARREADRRAFEQADAASQGAAERGSMRTALMAAALADR